MSLTLLLFETTDEQCTPSLNAKLTPPSLSLDCTPVKSRAEYLAVLSLSFLESLAFYDSHQQLDILLSRFAIVPRLTSISQTL